MTLHKKEQAPTGEVGDNQIASWAGDLLAMEGDIEALQTAKREFYATIREEHGKPVAASLKLAVKLYRMDDDKRDEAEEIDTEAQRILAIITKASRAPRATRVEIIEEFDAETGETKSTAARKDVHGLKVSGSTPAGPDARMQAGRAAPPTPPSDKAELGAGTQARPVDTQPAIGANTTADPAATVAENVIVAAEPIQESLPVVAHLNNEAQSSPAGVEGDEDRQPISIAAEQAAIVANKYRPHCQNPKRCISPEPRKHCVTCATEHAEAEGFSA